MGAAEVAAIAAIAAAVVRGEEMQLGVHVHAIGSMCYFTCRRGN